MGYGNDSFFLEPLNKPSSNENDKNTQLEISNSKTEDRITDLKEEITVLRKQLDIKDDTIKNLTTITESQLKGYKLIEAPGAKRSFLSRLKFW